MKFLKINQKQTAHTQYKKMARDFNWHFTEEESKMTIDNVKKSLNLSSNPASKVEDVHVFYHSNSTSR